MISPEDQEQLDYLDDWARRHPWQMKYGQAVAWFAVEFIVGLAAVMVILSMLGL